MKTTASLFILLHFLVCRTGLFAQVPVDTLTLRWGPSVNYGTYGQATVLVGDTLWHFGGFFQYGTPFGYTDAAFSFMEFLPLSSNFWVVDTTKILSRVWFNAETYNRKIFIFGGLQGATTHPNQVEIFDPSTRSISYGSPLPTPRRSAGSAQWSGKIYMIGGDRNDTQWFNNVDIYDVNTNTWTTGSPLPVSMSTDAVAYNGKIYTIGGFDGTVHNEIFAYDIGTNTWAQIGTIPQPVSANKLIAHNGYVFVIGDFIDLGRIMRYKIADGTWTTYKSNFLGRRHSSVAVVGTAAYIVAGNSMLDGSYQYYRVVQSIDLSRVTGLNIQEAQVPSGFQLKQNYPNPFNPQTTIRYTLDHSAFVTLKVFDIAGSMVKELLHETKPAGEHLLVWDGTNAVGIRAATGTYFYTIELEGKVAVKKMLVLR